MDRLTDDDARALLGLPMAYVLPAAEVLVAEARRIVETNLALARAPSRLMSPIWERKGSRAAVRAVQLPGEFARRYFTDGGRMVLGKAGVRTLVAELMPWIPLVTHIPQTDANTSASSFSLRFFGPIFSNSPAANALASGV